MVDDGRWGDDPRDRDDDRRDRERDDDFDGATHRLAPTDRERSRDDTRQPSRGPGSDDRGRDQRDTFTRHVDLPRGEERERVQDARGREYTLRGSESRSLSATGAFRVVHARDLRDHDGRAGDVRRGDLRHLREQGLLEAVRVHGQRDVAVTLTDRGRELLESNRRDGRGSRQEYYAGVKRERELEHDAQVYGAYRDAAERLAERGAEVDRVVARFRVQT